MGSEGKRGGDGDRLCQGTASKVAMPMLQACLGLTLDAWRGEIHVDRPRLPIGIDQLTIRHLTIRTAKVDLTFQRIGDRVVAFPEGLNPSPVPIPLHA